MKLYTYINFNEQNHIPFDLKTSVINTIRSEKQKPDGNVRKALEDEYEMSPSQISQMIRNGGVTLKDIPRGTFNGNILRGWSKNNPLTDGYLKIKDPDLGVVGVNTGLPGSSAVSGTLTDSPDFTLPSVKSTDNVEDMVVGHEKQHALDARGKLKALYRFKKPDINGALKDKINPLKGHANFVRLDDGRTTDNLNNLTEISADNGALKGRNTQDAIEYYNTAQQWNRHFGPSAPSYYNDDKDALDKQYQSVIDKLNDKGIPLSDEQLQQIKKKQLDRFHTRTLYDSGSNAAYLNKQNGNSPLYLDQVEPRRAKNIIRQSFNNALTNSTNQNAAKAGVATQWVDAGGSYLSPQLKNNLQQSIDYYNKTGQWFDYFSEHK